MKDQYFGDERDYFKYDLMLDLMSCLGVSRFTNIVMLTEPESNNEGRKSNYSRGNRRCTLCRFLRAVANGPKDERKVVRLRGYFTDFYPDIEYSPYMDDSKKDPFFSGSNRASYFGKIPKSHLQQAVILVDPDTGLLPRSGRSRGRKGHKWVTRCEMSRLKEDMGPSSVLVMFQYRWRTKWMSGVQFNYIEEKLGEYDIIHPKDTPAFVCLTKDPAVRTKLQEALRRHRRKEPDLKVYSAKIDRHV